MEKERESEVRDNESLCMLGEQFVCTRIGREREKKRREREEESKRRDREGGRERWQKEG
jgi:hypothetical protein